MIPETLYLKGFAGIRAGLNRDELTLDIAQLVGDAQLVALSGANGTGKTTRMQPNSPYVDFDVSTWGDLSPGGQFQMKITRGLMSPVCAVVDLMLARMPH
jgi:hypothetical protein